MSLSSRILLISFKKFFVSLVVALFFLCEDLDFLDFLFFFGLEYCEFCCDGEGEWE